MRTHKEVLKNLKMFGNFPETIGAINDMCVAAGVGVLNVSFNTDLNAKPKIFVQNERLGGLAMSSNSKSYDTLVFRPSNPEDIQQLLVAIINEQEVASHLRYRDKIQLCTNKNQRFSFFSKKPKNFEFIMNGIVSVVFTINLETHHELDPLGPGHDHIIEAIKLKVDSHGIWLQQIIDGRRTDRIKIENSSKLIALIEAHLIHYLTK